MQAETTGSKVAKLPAQLLWSMRITILGKNRGGMHVADLANIMEWTFVSETTVPKEAQEILVPGEEAHAAYKNHPYVEVITISGSLSRQARHHGKKVGGQDPSCSVHGYPVKMLAYWMSMQS